MMQVLDALSPIPIVVPDKELIRRAVAARAEYGVHFYDGMMWRLQSGQAAHEFYLKN
jgi:predicted nucleic acid-binding protein